MITNVCMEKNCDAMEVKGLEGGAVNIIDGGFVVLKDGVATINEGLKSAVKEQ